MNNRILLIESPFYRLFKDTYSLDRYPLSLAYLAGVIKRQTNWGVMVLLTGSSVSFGSPIRKCARALIFNFLQLANNNLSG